MPVEATIVEEARLYPGSCVCRACEGPFVDTGFEVGAEAGVRGERLYLGVKCVRVIATACGWASPEQAAELEAKIEQLAQEVDEQQDALAEARAARVVPIDQVKREMAAAEAGAPEAA